MAVRKTPGWTDFRAKLKKRNNLPLYSQDCAVAEINRRNALHHSMTRGRAVDQDGEKSATPVKFVREVKAEKKRKRGGAYFETPFVVPDPKARKTLGMNPAESVKTKQREAAQLAGRRVSSEQYKEKMKELFGEDSDDQEDEQSDEQSDDDQTGGAEQSELFEPAQHVKRPEPFDIDHEPGDKYSRLKMDIESLLKPNQDESDGDMDEAVDDSGVDVNVKIGGRNSRIVHCEPNI